MKLNSVRDFTSSRANELVEYSGYCWEDVTVQLCSRWYIVPIPWQAKAPSDCWLRLFFIAMVHVVVELVPFGYNEYTAKVADVLVDSMKKLQWNLR